MNTSVADPAAETITVYTVEVSCEFGNLEQLLDWCKSESRRSWTFNILEHAGFRNPGHYEFRFEGSADCTAFRLKWG